jgi:hypothetical protein
MKINGQTTTAKKFAFDGCHKIYLLESRKDETEARAIGYSILPISELQDEYECSCGLRFISNWKLDTSFVGQFEDATFGETS